jgi:hypothetical protein
MPFRSFGPQEDVVETTWSQVDSPAAFDTLGADLGAH